MGCLASQDHSEAIALLNTLNSLTQQKSNLLLKINSEKNSKQLGSKPLDLKLKNESQITKEYLDTRISNTTESLNAIKEIQAEEEPDFGEFFENFDELVEHPFYDEMKSSLKSGYRRINDLKMKLKELNYLKEDLENENSTTEELKQRRVDNEKELELLKIATIAVKDKISQLDEYLESLKRKKRRFTVAILQPNKAQLRSKVLLKHEMIKKIDIIKSEQRKFIQKIEDNKAQMKEELKKRDCNTPRNYFSPASLSKGAEEFKDLLEGIRIGERSVSSLARIKF